MKHTARSRRASLRTRVLAIGLVPGAALLVTASTFAGVTLSDGITARDYARHLKQEVPPITEFVKSVQNERTLSLRRVGGDEQAATELVATRRQTDKALAHMIAGADAFKRLDPRGADKSAPMMTDAAARLPVIRKGVDEGTVAADDVGNFFTQIIGIFPIAIDSSARNTADPRTATELAATADLLAATDLHAQAVSVAVSVLPRTALGATQRLAVAELIGSYRNQLQSIASRMTDDEAELFQALTRSSTWKQAVKAEDSLVRTGKTGLSTQRWLAIEEKVDAQLLGLWSRHLEYSNAQAKSYADDLLMESAGLGMMVLIVTLGASVVALRLANGLVRRLRRLSALTLEQVDHQLPAILSRLRNGEVVDVTAEVSLVDDGSDEIGQAARAFLTAQLAAFDAAVAETQTRSGLNKVFLDIAHRSQGVVHRQLAVLDQAEAKQNDPEHLELLFQLDHLATRARRNAENLLILGGAQPGRKWRGSVALEEIVRSAISETENFARVSAVRLPDVRVLGSAVTDVIHLLAELVDNATAFSPPESIVAVRGALVGKGVVVEIEDQGLGMKHEERERINEMLRIPPDFQAMALAGQRNLGLFVIGHLAQRHEISVSLLDSAYGGIRSIVLIPNKLLDMGNGRPEPTRDAQQVAPRRGMGRHRDPGLVPEPVHDPVPRMPVNAGPQIPQGWIPQDSAPVHEPERQIDADTPHGIELAPRLAGRSRTPLPRRRRQQHLAPQLQPDTEAAATAAEAPLRLRNPEQARASMTSFQRGSRHGRDFSAVHDEQQEW